jgi:hypothetical protein
MINTARIFGEVVAGQGVGRAREPPHNSRNSHRPHLPFRLEVSRNDLNKLEFNSEIKNSSLFSTKIDHSLPHLRVFSAAM